LRSPRWSEALRWRLEIRNVRRTASVEAKRVRSWQYALSRIPKHGGGFHQYIARIAMAPHFLVLVETSAAAMSALLRVMFAARTSMATTFHARATAAGAVETHASRRAANVASLCSSRRVSGTRSARRPSAQRIGPGPGRLSRLQKQRRVRRQCSARIAMVRHFLALPETNAAAMSALRRVMFAAKTLMDTTFHARATAVGAVETHAMRRAASVASPFSNHPVNGTLSARRPSAQRVGPRPSRLSRLRKQKRVRLLCCARIAMGFRLLAPPETAVAAMSVSRRVMFAART